MNAKSKVVFTILFALMTPIFSSNVFAVSYDIKEMTPEIKGVLDARRARNEQLRALKEQGAVGENNSGYVQVLKSVGDADALVAAENKDRRMIYNVIVTQNNLPPEALKTVEQVFAQVQRDKAAYGETIQDETGSWVVK